MRLAAAILLLAVAGCSRAAADETDVLKAVLATASEGFRTEALCLRPKLIERRHAFDFNRWAFIGARAPAGFEAVDTPIRPEGYRFADKHVPLNIANRWRLSADEEDVCVEATIPVIAGDRALVSLSFEDMTLFGRMNFWLERREGAWRVVARNNDHQDI